jgi:hypothetical protein
MRRTTGLLLIVMFLAACGLKAPQPPSSRPLEAQANLWQQLGDTAGVGSESSLVTKGSTATLAFVETGNIRVKKWDGNTWTNVGDPLNGSTATGTSASDPSLALDSSGNPVVAWLESDGSVRTIFVQRFNGSAWVNVAASNVASGNVFEPSLALDGSGNAVVAWSERNGSTYNIYLQRFNGSGWSDLTPAGLSGSSAATFSDAEQPSLVLDASGNPVVAWTEGDGSVYSIYVQHYNGSTWTNLTPTGLSGSSAALSDTEWPSLALNSSGNPIVAWAEDAGNGTSYNIHVQRYNGTTWTTLTPSGLSASSALGSDAFNASLGLDAAGNPSVAWEEFDGSSTNLYVQQFSSSSWTNVGSVPLDTSLANNASLPSLSYVNGSLNVAWQEGSETSNNLYVKRYVVVWLDVGGALDVASGQRATNSVMARKGNNNPVVAWEEDTSTPNNKNVYVKEWTGTAWNPLGSALDRNVANNAVNPSVAMRSDNKPVVAWQENNSIFVKRWTGSLWRSTGSALDTVLANVAVTPSLALDSTNLPVVAYVENNDILVKKANGLLPTSTWTSPYGITPLDITSANVASRPSLALKSDNLPVVAWYEHDGTSTNIYVKEWNGSAWLQLGSTLDMTPSQNAKDVVLALRTDNRPVVAWEEIGNIYVKQWNGSAWQSVGGVVDKVVSRQALRPALDLRSDNKPVVAWQEGTSTNYDVFVKRWTGTTWAQVSSNALDKTLSQTAQRPALVLKSNNNPMVSFDEFDGTSENVYVKQF